MNIIGNIIWFILGGLIASLLWFIAGVLVSITIIGIPLGKQFFKFSRLILFPFGKDVQTQFSKHPIANVIWAILAGWEMALSYLFFALILAVTVIGIPFAIQWVKLTRLALFPFGARIR